MSDDTPKLVVEFTQQFTVTPPDFVENSVEAEGWFWNIYPDIGRDVVDPKQKGAYEIKHIEENND